MKKFVILGSGTAGLIAATMIKRRWQGEVDVSVYYDFNKKNIGVGESTTPIVNYFLKEYLKVPLPKLLDETSTTIKLGISFKDWIKETEYFHGFPELDINSKKKYPSSIYSILNDCFDGGSLHHQPTTTLPGHFFDAFLFALHLDTQEFSNYIYNQIKDEVTFIDDIAKKVNSDGKNIQSIVFKNSGEVKADYFIDASGFNSILLNELNPEWNDMSKWLPLDRAIPQQIPYNFEEVPSYTVAEATENGWIWQIPIGNRYGTGYIYSSKFTSDHEAREKYDIWLRKKYNVGLDTDRIIKYNPGYYTDYWIGNCLAIGLSSGFIEPLESTGIHIIIQQVKDFIDYNSTLKNLEYNRKECNRRIKILYEEVSEFVCLHYATNREDSEFWRYMKENKTEWVKAFEQKCKQEFLEEDSIDKSKLFWNIDSYIQVAHGLKMFTKEGILEFLKWIPNGDSVLESSRLDFMAIQKAKGYRIQVPHKDLLSQRNK